MKTTIKYILMIMAIIPIPYGCDLTDGGGTCPDNSYAFNGFNALQVNDEAVSNDTLEVNPLTLQFIFDISSRQAAMVPQKEPHFSSFLIPSASALSCLGPHVDPYIQSVSITSNRDFNADYPSDSELRGFFDSIYRMNDTGALIIDVINFEPNATAPLQGYSELTLMENPDKPGVHVFTLTIELSTGRTYETVTGPIQLN